MHNKKFLSCVFEFDFICLAVLISNSLASSGLTVATHVPATQTNRVTLGALPSAFVGLRGALESEYLDRVRSPGIMPGELEVLVGENKSKLNLPCSSSDHADERETIMDFVSHSPTIQDDQESKPEDMDIGDASHVAEAVHTSLEARTTCSQRQDIIHL